MFNFNFFKSSSTPEAEHSHENTWNPNNLAMQQPASPAAPSTNPDVVSQQPVCFIPRCTLNLDSRSNMDGR